MAAILRIRGARPSALEGRDGAAPDPMKAYVDRLVRLVPAEVVGIYLAGKSVIQAVHPAVPDAARRSMSVGDYYWVGWTLFCLAAVVFVRAWATSDRRSGTPAEWPAVAIATVSFAVWVYSMGDAFARFAGVWQPLLAALLVVAWTFAAPFLYRDEEPNAPPAPPAPPRREDEELPRAGGMHPYSATAGPFGEGDAEKATLDAAEALSHHRPSLGDKVSKAFTDASQVRELLAKTQDVIENRHGIRVDLASGPDKEMEEHGKSTYRALAGWVLKQVQSRKASDA